jgi:hypothetical protein
VNSLFPTFLEDINVNIQSQGERIEWKLTCFYRHPSVEKRHKAWALLKHLKQFSPCPWLCVGDFNEITTADEKKGGVIRREGHMGKFRETLAGRLVL